MRNLHHLLTYYTLCFRCLTSGRELPKIPANQAKFAQFTHISRELREFHAFCIKIHPYLEYFRSLTFDREPRKLERINQISCSSPTTHANYAKFAESAPMTSRLGVNPGNSRKCTANNASSVPFAQRTGK